MLSVLFVLMLSSCVEKRNQNPVEPQSAIESNTPATEQTGNLLAKTEGYVYVLKVTPSKSQIIVGDCLYFTGNVTLGGKPVNGLSITVQDPMKQQTIANAARTDSKGNFTYYPENMCPAKYNDMSGLFEFSFVAGSTTTKSRVTVNTKAPSGYDLVNVFNSSKSTYKVKLVVDNKDKGTTTISPGKSLNLFSGNQFANSTINATIMDIKGKTLWKLVFNNTRRYTPLIKSFLNPYYSNYWLNSFITMNGATRTRLLNSIGKVYNDYVNKQWNVGGFGVSTDNNVTHGVSTAAGLGVTGPGCETFLGLRGKCKVSCDASVGLEVTVCGGLCIPIEPFFELGCGISCKVEIASATCQVASVSGTASATYK
jgi:hypothetical protein